MERTEAWYTVFSSAWMEASEDFVVATGLSFSSGTLLLAWWASGLNNAVIIYPLVRSTPGKNSRLAHDPSPCL
jgi:hypothetical protein